MAKLKKIGLVFGTRPEAIKMAPVYLECAKRGLQPVIIATAQHRQMLDQVLSLFGLTTDFDLDIMTENQTLTSLTSKLCASLGEVFRNHSFDAVLVQGDTTSTFTGALTAFYHKIAVGHVEAGLRTSNRYDPFPEEMNRRLTTRLSTWHFAPTKLSEKTLLEEGTTPDHVFLTGNTVIDAMQWVLTNKRKELLTAQQRFGLSGKKFLLVTMHRRENWGEKMKGICTSIVRVLEENPELWVFFPVHLNPRVREVVFPLLQNHPRVILTDPIDYLDFIAVMENAWFILSDSGGVQEEAPTLGKPVLILRNTTERPEAIEAHSARLVGTDAENVYRCTMELLNNPTLFESMKKIVNPFGDGKASVRICDILEKSCQ